MNQIIFSNDNYDNIENVENISNIPNKNNKKNFSKSLLFKSIFFISIGIILFLNIYYIVYYYRLNKKEELSKNLSFNFGLKTLYSSNENYSTNLDTNNYVIGIIEIKTIGINYPIINECTDKNLEIAPCRFVGPNPNEIGNLCIVAHNYNNYKFFSKINKLNINDIISIYDLNGKKIDYYVFDKFETYYNDLNCTKQDTNRK